MKELCPLCSSTLLRHLHQREVAWFCTSCRQEMPNFSADRLNAIYKDFLKKRNSHDRHKKSDTPYQVIPYSSINNSAIVKEIKVNINPQINFSN